MQQSLLDRASPYLLLVLTTLFWAGNFNVGRAISGEVPPLGLSFWRWIVAFAILLPFAYRPMKEQWSVLKQNVGLVLLLSVLGVAMFNSFVYLGLQTTTATNGVLMQSHLAHYHYLALHDIFRRQSQRPAVVRGLGVISRRRA